ncbi:hypothetical protein ACS74_11805 [Exiguobacterium acetylicum]|nr:hypothetical protein ACS74_11805 [Exiguobacterium acetylicum]
MIICHPGLVKKKYSLHTTPTGKAHFCAVRDKQDPFSCLKEAGKLACVSPEERALKEEYFFEFTPFMYILTGYQLHHEGPFSLMKVITMKE